MSDIKIIGIDPGKNGAIAAIEKGKLVCVEKISSDILPMIDQFKRIILTGSGIKKVYLEKVKSFGRNDRSRGKRAHSFAKNYGMIQNALDVSGIPYTEIEAHNGWHTLFAIQFEPLPTGTDNYENRKDIVWQAMKNEYGIKRLKYAADAIAIAHCMTSKYGVFVSRGKRQLKNKLATSLYDVGGYKK